MPDQLGMIMDVMGAPTEVRVRREGLRRGNAEIITSSISSNSQCPAGQSVRFILWQGCDGRRHDP